MNLRILFLSAVSFLPVAAFANEAEASPSSFITPDTVRSESIRLQPRLIGFAVTAPGQLPRMFRRKAAQGRMFFTLGESAAPATEALVQYRDEWNESEEWDADDYSGTIRAVNENHSLRYRGIGDAFPLREGGTIVETPETGSYAPLTTESIAAGPAGSVERKIVGRGETRVLPAGARRGRALGEYEETFSMEDREEDAVRRVARQLVLPPERRAPGAVQQGEEPEAFFTRHGTGPAWLVQQARLTCTFAVKTAGQLAAKLDYRVGGEKRTETFAVANPGNGTVTVVVEAVPRPYADLFRDVAPATHRIAVEAAEVHYRLETVTLTENPQL